MFPGWDFIDNTDKLKRRRQPPHIVALTQRGRSTSPVSAQIPDISHGEGDTDFEPSDLQRTAVDRVLQRPLTARGVSYRRSTGRGSATGKSKCFKTKPPRPATAHTGTNYQANSTRVGSTDFEVRC